MGHPIEVMDLSFALQALSAKYIAENGKSLSGGVYDVPSAIDEEVAERKLASLGVRVEKLTKEQSVYLTSWDCGT
jgi:adenosylhomocysteinase